mmetsp:Transcript_8244/g.12326  ORF Transcript_8244/g.12326 Transcript_8244/m.12326 type:complete len:429 (-) Transcript_8244:378-1664(-)
MTDGEEGVKRSDSNSLYDELRSWVDLQRESFNMLFLLKDKDVIKNGANGNDTNGNIETMTERHYMALLNIGLDLKHNMLSFRPDEVTVVDEDGIVVDHGKILGRKPAILSLDEGAAILQVTSPDVTPTPLSTVGRMGRDQWNELVWLARYKEMKKYREEHGHCHVTLSLDNGDNERKGIKNINSKVNEGHRKLKRLALWAYDQRMQYRNFKTGWERTSMTQRRIKRLNKIGFDWDYSGHDDSDECLDDDKLGSSTWNKRMVSLRRYKERHGNCYVPLAYTSDRKLGQWVHEVRRIYQADTGNDSNEKVVSQQQRNSIEYKNNKKQLTSDRVNQLLSEGFDLTCDNITFGRKASESIWNARLDELSEYKQMHGHINVSLDYASPYYDLGMWLREQHSLYSVCEDENGQTYLTMERIQKLEQLGLDWGSK